MVTIRHVAVTDCGELKMCDHGVFSMTGTIVPNEKLKEKFGNCTRKTFSRFTTKDSYTWNITHNTEITAV